MYKDGYSDKIKETLDILDKREFSYDPSRDKVYQMYRDSVKTSAELALADATGLAAALNGGYSTSYAQQAGQSAYMQRMKEADEILPQLYKEAYSRYSDETDDIEDKLELLRDLSGDEWDRYLDMLEEYNDEGERLFDRYTELSDEEFDRFYSMYKLTLK